MKKREAGGKGTTLLFNGLMRERGKGSPGVCFSRREEGKKYRERKGKGGFLSHLIAFYNSEAFLK